MFEFCVVYSVKLYTKPYIESCVQGPLPKALTHFPQQEAFQQVYQAFHVLTNAELRAKYLGIVGEWMSMGQSADYGEKNGTLGTPRYIDMFHMFRDSTTCSWRSDPACFLTDCEIITSPDHIK